MFGGERVSELMKKSFCGIVRDGQWRPGLETSFEFVGEGGGCGGRKAEYGSA